MTKIDRQSLLIGLLAGIATALLSLSAGTPSSASFFLTASMTLPLLIASLGWGNAAALVAVVVAGLSIAVLLQPLAALSILVTSLLPAAWIGYLANLARPAEEVGGTSGELAWYPLSRILLHLCGLVTLGLVVLGFVVGYGKDVIGPVVDAFVRVMQQQDPTYHPDAATTAQMKDLLAKLLPAVQGGAWVLILFFSLYVAAAVVRASGRAKRPRDDVPRALRMPRAGLGAMLLGLVLLFVGGIPELIGSAICGAFGTGFVLSGFAVMHDRTRGKPWRMAVLCFAYVAVILFTVPIIFFLVAGLAESAGAIPGRQRDRT
ncbi:DUF2232 domain-containing protein [Pararhizobium mangrovi]|uniref:DUF2232 domain-containing protein n=1 Tax=Pararhizobium mangrovi TaxID=2590452 RepID=A0A506UEX6_9HYPH|nr:DUF2232 domain-containing protein [Pararhizobium mangrovi]TPW32036.1 DUF2232 domain-containing protein [Pararhizobium mangrovi]